MSNHKSLHPCTYSPKLSLAETFKLLEKYAPTPPALVVEGTWITV